MAKNYYPNYVPHSGPKGAKILFVGEAPGETEIEEGKPFVGAAGQILTACLNRAGLSRDEVRMANLCNYRPYMNRFENILQEEVLKDGLRELFAYIGEYRPNIIVPLGNWPLHYLTGLAKFNNKKQVSGITKFRGSILPCLFDSSIKCIPTLHPSFVARDASQYPTFDLDIQRIVKDANTPDFNLPVREFIIDPQGILAEEWIERLCASDYLAIDIETVKKSKQILCVGFSPSPSTAVCFVPTHASGRLAISRILEHPHAKKVFQFGSFDTEQLRLNQFLLRDERAEELERPYWWDTYVAQHILAPELPRSLEYLTSIYTREPYYKRAGRSTIPDDAKGWSEKFDKQALYEYNCRDCCVTAEIYEQQVVEMEQHPSRHIFAHSMSLVGDLGLLSRTGMPFDSRRQKELELALASKWARKQDALDLIVGRKVNVNSSKIVPLILYDKEFLGLPVRRKRGGGVTADEDAIVSLIAYCKDRLDSVVKESTKQEWRTKLAICKSILEIRGIRKLLSTYIRIRLSDDGRLRSTYKVGPETGRTASTKFVDGTGLNAQTFPRDPVEVPDELAANIEELLKEIEEEANKLDGYEDLDDEDLDDESEAA